MSPRKSRTILVRVGIWTIWANEFTLSENIFKRNGICDGSGWNSRVSVAEGLKLCRNRNAWRSNGARSSSWVLDGVFPGDASSSALSDSSPPRSIFSPSSCSKVSDSSSEGNDVSTATPTYLVIDLGPEAAAHIATAAGVLENHPAKLFLHTAGVHGG